MTDIPQAIWSGTFRLFGVDVKCHTLSDGRRIIEAESMAKVLDAMGDVAAMRIGADDIEEFARWRSAKDVTPKGDTNG